MQQLAERKLTDTKSNLKAVVGAVRDLELSQKYFEWLALHGDRMKFDLNGAKKEADNCKAEFEKTIVYHSYFLENFLEFFLRFSEFSRAF